MSGHEGWTKSRKAVLLAGSSHPRLAQQVATRLGLPILKTIISNFANGETRVEIQESIRGCDAYVIQPLSTSEDGKRSVNDALMEMLLLVSALRGSSARTVTAVIPIYGYARQDKKDQTRSAITARLVADMLEVAGIDRAIAIDLHASQIQGFFRKPLDNLQAEPLLTAHMKKHLMNQGECVIVSPDAGGAKRAASVAARLNTEYAIISKFRKKANAVASMKLVGNVEDKICIIVDDMADTCGTLCLAAQTLLDNGAKEVHAYVVHGLFSGPALGRINKSNALKSVTATNTLPQLTNQRKCSKLKILDISQLLADAIHFVATDQSLTSNL